MTGMIEWFNEVAAGLHEFPVLQAVVAGLCTFVLEDPTTVGSGLLVAEGKMDYLAAFTGLSSGIAVGDFGLYLLGRLAHKRVESWGLIDAKQLEKAGAWFNRNIISTVLAARFIPGMRLPTYVAAGALKVSSIRFLLVAVIASVVWTLALLALTIRFGEKVLAHAGPMKFYLGFGFVALLAIVQWTAARHSRKAKSRVMEGPKEEADFKSFFELWPPILFYTPVVLYCIWLAVRLRGFMLFTASNPSIYSGGMILESKSEILDLVSEEKRHHIAPVDRLHDAERRPRIAGRLQRGAGPARRCGHLVSRRSQTGCRAKGLRSESRLQFRTAWRLP